LSARACEPWYLYYFELLNITCYSILISDSAQVASQNLATLIETQKSAESLTVALEALNKELDRQEFQNTLLPSEPDSLQSLYVAANELQQHHQDSIVQLRDITAALGLLHVRLPPDLTDAELEFVKQLILLQAVKTMLWNRLQQIQDEMNPVHESASRAGDACSLGMYGCSITCLPCSDHI